MEESITIGLLLVAYLSIYTLDMGQVVAVFHDAVWGSNLLLVNFTLKENCSRRAILVPFYLI